MPATYGSLMRAPQRALVLLWAAWLTLAAPSGAQEAGRVTGRATQAETGQSLVGAAISVDATSLSTITDAEGRFVLSRVPEGVHTLRLTFIGREQQSQPVTVTAGETTLANFGAPVAEGLVGCRGLILEGVTPSGHRLRVDPEELRGVAASVARLEGRHLGPVVLLGRRITLGGLTMPRYGYFLTGTEHFTWRAQSPIQMPMARAV
ncbi:MAG TPA: carboxypeptidase-like regulatory domain-containing protein [Longimicrobiales bacterium]|nr:carboxypeptidase-like regulatory domain-containing protein [Longimicrobiales bacterium]